MTDITDMSEKDDGYHGNKKRTTKYKKNKKTRAPLSGAIYARWGFLYERKHYAS